MVAEAAGRSCAFWNILGDITALGEDIGHPSAQGDCRTLLMFRGRTSDADTARAGDAGGAGVGTALGDSKVGMRPFSLIAITRSVLQALHTSTVIP